MRRFRYWLADLISGGELTRQSSKREMYADLIQNIRPEKTPAFQHIKAMEVREHETSARVALALIAAEVRPTSNATVKRMGRIASEALK